MLYLKLVSIFQKFNFFGVCGGAVSISGKTKGRYSLLVTSPGPTM